MVLSSFFLSVKEKNRKNAYQYLYTSLEDKKALTNIVQDLLLLSTQVVPKRKIEIHPIIIINSLKNILSDNINSPSIDILKYAVDILIDHSYRENDEDIIKGTMDSGIGLFAFVGELEDSLQNSKWRESQELAAKIYLASDRSPSIIETLCSIAIQNVELNTIFIHNLLRAYYFQNNKDSVWSYTMCLLKIIQIKSLPQPKRLKALDINTFNVDVLYSTNAFDWVIFSAASRIWAGDYIRINSYKRELSNWLYILDISKNKIHKQKYYPQNINFIKIIEDLINGETDYKTKYWDIIKIESLRYYFKYGNKEQVMLAYHHLITCRYIKK